MMIPLDFQILPVFHRFFFIFVHQKQSNLHEFVTRASSLEKNVHGWKSGANSAKILGKTGGKSSDARETFGRWFGFLVVVGESSTFLIKDMNVYYIYII